MSTSNTQLLARQLKLFSPPVSVSISIFVLFSYVGVVMSNTIVDPYNIGFSYIQGLTGFFLLSFVPGFLIIDYIRNNIRTTDILYAIGISVSMSMILGWLLNLIYLRSNLWKPFEKPHTMLFYISVYTILTVIIYSLSESDRSDSILEHFHEYDSRILVILSVIPVLAVTGAHMINKGVSNNITLAVFVMVGIVPIAVLWFDKQGKYHVLSVGITSISLLLGNTVINTYNREGEYSIGKIVLQNGFWTPEGGLAAMPRIGVLHPVYSLIMDVSLFWEFKLVHPVLFTLVPIITYKITEKYFSKNVAFLSAILYIFMPRTHTFLGRNTRTGSAILFTAFFILIVIDSEMSSRVRTLIATVFFWSIIASHYGIGPLVIFAVIVSSVISFILPSLLSGQQDSNLSYRLLLLSLLVTYSTYTYSAEGTFEFLVETVFRGISGVLSGGTTGTATRSISFEMPSLSYEIVFYGHLTLAILMSIGLGLICIRYILRGSPIDETYSEGIERRLFPEQTNRIFKDVDFIGFAIGLYLILPLSFGPITLSSARIFGLVMVALAPFSILLLNSVELKSIKSKSAPIVLFVFLLMTSGFVSATMTHDVSPNPIIDGERIQEDGSRNEKFAYYRSSVPFSTITTSAFIRENIPANSIVEKSRLTRYRPQFIGEVSAEQVRFERLDRSPVPPGNFIFISKSDINTNTITQQWLGFVYYEYHSISSYPSTNKVYTTGNDRVLHA